MMSRVCIITYDEYVNIPYVKGYENFLNTYKIPYDIVLWQRNSCDSEVSKTAKSNYVFREATKASKFSKILPFIKWRNYVKKILRTSCYSKIIICTTIPGILLSDVLCSKYKQKYLLDIRDYTYEHIGLFTRIEYKLIDYSELVVISSPSFKEWLPSKKDRDVVISHNIHNTEYTVHSTAELKKLPIIRIGFVGGIRYFSICKRIISTFANNPRFQLSYVGKQHPGCDLQEYCKLTKVHNVAFGERYINNQKPEIYQNIDMINSIYGDSSPEVRSALPNKLYDCIIFKKPIIVSKNTFLATVVENYKLGIAVDVENDDIVNMVNEYIEDFSSSQFLEGCENFLRCVMEEQSVAESKIEDFFRNIV